MWVKRGSTLLNVSHISYSDNILILQNTSAATLHIETSAAKDFYNLLWKAIQDDKKYFDLSPKKSK